ncbi:jg2574 [Pararge aegeria aegeria]|uniref:Jg2574 protein n=1 Tax=Pararge aegeria aegeria TaxID=348720 RepID=A0A8S4QVQ2_9NEOP|nr:jg2574 [Pararge aegeria aegeria]
MDIVRTIFEQCVLPKTFSLTMAPRRRLKVPQRAIERAMLRVPISTYQIRNEGIRYRHSSMSHETEVAMGGAHSSESRWTLGSQGIKMAISER